MNKSNSSNNGIGVLGLLGVVFIVLKLTNIINWSWWYVTLPLWGGFALIAGIGLLWGIIWLIHRQWKAIKRKRRLANKQI